jgi:uroporphyrinogen III methyltransferase / synthase
LAKANVDSVGKVYLVGAGPGDPGLLTLKGLECVRRAEVLVYDRLASPSIVAEAPLDAEMVYVGKASSDHTMRQDDINRLLAERALQGKTVVRLKGGDPFIFGRGGEEAEVLVASGVPFEVVPGITSAISAPAYAGIPVTHRGLCSTLGIITGHEDPTKTESSIKWDKIACGIDTIVFLMGVENLPGIVSQLVANGRDPQTPIALVRWGTRPDQETLTGTLSDIVEKVEREGFKSPAVTVVGEVVGLREKLRWFDNRPLFGKRVLVTRSREQSSALSELLRQYGAEPIEFPVIKISPPDSYAELDAALDRTETYDWMLFTSANAVYAVIDRLRELGRDIRWLKGPKIGAVGPKTAETLGQFGVHVGFTPSEFVGEAVAREFPEDPSGKRILIPQAKDARETVAAKLTELAASVDVATAYQTVIERSDATRIKQLLADGGIDIITFTSSSTVTNFVELVGVGSSVSLPYTVRVACIGPITAETAVSHDLEPDIVATEYTVEGLVRAIVSTLGSAPEASK